MQTVVLGIIGYWGDSFSLKRMVDQPSGTVTLVFTDIEGSTTLLSQLGQEAYREVLAVHRSAVREAFAHFQATGRLRGRFVLLRVRVRQVSCCCGNGGDSGPRGWAGADPRWGAHRRAGPDPPGYVGIDVHRTARIMAAAHGGQVIVSQTTRDLLDGADGLRDLGEHRLKDLTAPLRLFQLGHAEFAPLKSLYRTNLPIPATRTWAANTSWLTSSRCWHGMTCGC